MLKSVAQYLGRAAEVWPNKKAFTDKKNSLTFVELNKESRMLARRIVFNIGLGRSRPIGVYLPKGVDCVISFLGVAYSGNFYTPLDITMPKSRLQSIVSTLDPAMIVTDLAHFDSLAELINRERIIVFNEANETNVTDDVISEIQQKAIDSDPLYVMFTSGSTGVPKGVVISHRSVIDYTEWLAETFNFSETTVFGNQAPFHFDNSILDLYSTLRNGCETVIIPDEKFLSPKNLVLYIEESSINTIFWVPSALCLLANSGILKNHCPKTLNKILFCGEVMPAKQLNIWRRVLPNAMYANLYGPTEITDVCACYIVEREFRDDESLPIGYPCNNTEILVLNEAGERVLGEEVGELYVRGTCLSYGYYGSSEKTSTSFIQNPLHNMYPEIVYRTGDLVRYNDRGELLYIGRRDFQIKHSGHRIELGEIETIAQAFSETEMCCALYDHERKNIVLTVSPEPIDKKALYKHLKDHLPQYMLPESILPISKLPLNPNGKIDRGALREIVLKQAR